MSILYDEILGRIRKGGGVTASALAAVLTEAEAKEWTHTAGRNNTTVSNVYLRGPGNVPTNQSGFVQNNNATIVGISAKAQASGTWTIEIRKNGSVAILASLTVTASTKDSVNGLSVDVSLNDSIEIYINGTNINKPSAIVTMRKRP